MPSRNETEHQQELLAIYRRNLAHEVRRAGRYGGESAAPLDITSGIYEARKNIRSIKAWLRERGVSVEDERNDEPGVESDDAPRPVASGSSSYVFHAPVTIGQGTIGGQQTIEEMKVHMGDSINFSGATISNSNVNVKAKLDNVTQNINTLPQADQATKQALEQLVGQLRTELEKATASGHADDAEKVSSRTDAMVTEAAKTKPDKELIEFNAESLKRAAGNIATVLPSVLTIATQIVDYIHKLVP